MFTVYLRTNLITGKQYVGLTSMTIEERAGNNGSRYENCPYLYAAIKKYGWNNFESVILAKDLTHEKACELEQYYIQLLQFTKNGTFVAEYTSSAESSRQTGIGSIKQAVRGKIKTAGGYIWKRKGK